MFSKNTMKKLTVLLALFVMATFFVACGDTQSTDSQSSDVEVAKQEDSVEEDTSDADTQSTADVVDEAFLGQWVPYTIAAPDGQALTMEEFAAENEVTVEEIELIYEFKSDGTVVTTMPYLDFTSEGVYQHEGNVITVNFQDLINEMTYDSEGDTIKLIESSTGYTTIFNRK